MSSEKSPPHSVARHYKPILQDELGSRRLILKSFLIKGDLIELVSVWDERTKDDGFIQGIREEILGKPPFHGGYARKLGLIHVASRRVSHESNDILYKTTGAKRNKQTGDYMHDEHGDYVFFPRAYTLRLVSDKERDMDPEERNKYRKRMLNTLAHILEQYDKGDRKRRPTGKDGSPSRDRFPPTIFEVPQEGWDLTPEQPLPLDWYITDQMVAKTIQGIYRETDIGRWDMFVDNVPEADCFFSPPYTYMAKTFGFRNPQDSSVWHAQHSIVEAGEEAVVKQEFDANDVIPLD